MRDSTTEIVAAVIIGMAIGALAMGLVISARGLSPEAPTPPPPVVQVTPTPRPSGPPFVVGEGVAARMEELHDAPASDELYLPIMRGQISLTLSLRGALYVYTFERNATDVFAPSDRAP